MTDKNILLLEEIHSKTNAILESQKAWANVPHDVEEMCVMIKEIDADLKDIIKTLGCDPQKVEQAT